MIVQELSDLFKVTDPEHDARLGCPVGADRTTLIKSPHARLANVYRTIQRARPIPMRSAPTSLTHIFGTKEGTCSSSRPQRIARDLEDL